MDVIPLSTFNILLLLLAGCFYISIPPRGEVTERDTGLLNILAAFFGIIIAWQLRSSLLNGSLIESFEYQSQIYNVSYSYLFLIVAIVLGFIFCINMMLYIKQRWN